MSLPQFLFIPVQGPIGTGPCSVCTCTRSYISSLAVLLDLWALALAWRWGEPGAYSVSTAGSTGPGSGPEPGPVGRWVLTSEGLSTRSALALPMGLVVFVNLELLPRDLFTPSYSGPGRRSFLRFWGAKHRKPKMLLVVYWDDTKDGSVLKTKYSLKIRNAAISKGWTVVRSASPESKIVIDDISRCPDTFRTAKL